MKLVIDPAATALWDKAGSIDTLQGTIIKTPTTEEGWLAAEQEAATVVEGGNLILLPARVRKLNPKDEDWTKFANKMIELGLAEKAAVEAKDGQKMFDIGGRLYEEACTACHTKYLVPFLPKT